MPCPDMVSQPYALANQPLRVSCPHTTDLPYNVQAFQLHRSWQLMSCDSSTRLTGNFSDHTIQAYSLPCATYDDVSRPTWACVSLPFCSQPFLACSTLQLLKDHVKEFMLLFRSCLSRAGYSFISFRLPWFERMEVHRQACISVTVADHQLCFSFWAATPF